MLSALAMAVCCFQVKYDNSKEHDLYSVDAVLLKRAWERGAKLGRDKKGEVWKELDYLREDLGKVRSPSGQRWRASFAVHLPPFARAVAAGFDSGRKFETFDEAGRKFVDEVSGHAMAPDRTIRFVVVLNAWPGINDFNSQVNRAADEEDTVATDFILVADEKVVRLKSAQEGGTRDLGGSYTSPITDVTNVTTSVGNANIYSTVSRTSWVQNGYNAFQATYWLMFPYFDSEGRANISKETKKLLLRVLKKSGQVQEVEFKVANEKIKVE